MTHQSEQAVKEELRKPLECTLMKFTNVVKGWQFRYFILDADKGELRYYLTEESKLQKPRGTLLLSGAAVTPSDEDFLVFSVVPQSGETYKLKCADFRQKQEWINRLRFVAEEHANARLKKSQQPLKAQLASENVRRGTAKESAMLHNVHRMLVSVAELQLGLVRNVDCLQTPQHCLDKDVLLLKATSSALLSNLEQCSTILRQCQGVSNYSTSDSFGDGSFLITDAAKENSSPSSSSALRRTTITGGSLKTVEKRFSQQLSDVVGEKPGFEMAQDVLDSVAAESNLVDEVDPADEQLDADMNFYDNELGSVEQHKTLILSILSRLKLGMDLTRVPLPTFILQSRSFLETCSDFLGNCDLFVRINDEPTAEARMIAVLKWYLTSFNFGCRGGISKKPYNPLLGEVFRCTWLPRHTTQPCPVTFIAEQVSHHPPLSAFYAECPAKGMHLNSFVWTKSKFMGMSVGANLVGESVLYLAKHGEAYRFAFPSVFGRSVLTTPWMELGGKCVINCEATGLVASVMFHTKPFYGGKLHRVTAEIRGANHLSSSQSSLSNPAAAGSISSTPPSSSSFSLSPSSFGGCKVSGEWNRSLEFAYGDGRLEVVDCTALPIAQRLIRPIEKQHPRESRRLWQSVTNALRASNEREATAAKTILENRQRQEIARLADFGGHTTRFFQKSLSSNAWIYVKMPSNILE